MCVRVYIYKRFKSHPAHRWHERMQCKKTADTSDCEVNFHCDDELPLYTAAAHIAHAHGLSIEIYSIIEYD